MPFPVERVFGPEFLHSWFPKMVSNVVFSAETITDFETQLAQALERRAPLVAIGNPGEHVGAGRVRSSDEDWQGTVECLARMASFIIVLPMPRQSVLWEMAWLRTSGLFRKTVFVVPPRVRHRLRALRDDAIDWQAFWSELVAESASRGVRIPDYRPDGQLFTLGDDGNVLHQTLLDSHSGGRWLETLIAAHLDALARLGGSEMIAGSKEAR